MPASVEQLFALQSVDARLRSMKLELGELEKSASEVRVEVDAKRQLAQVGRKEMSEMERRRREIEAKLADEEERMKDRRMRMQRIRNEKELGAIRREIELNKEQNALLEEELLKVFETGEVKAGELKTIEEDLAQQESKLKERERELAERTQALRDELERCTQERAEAAAVLEDSLLRRYELIFERKGGLAVVEVHDRDHCSGCRMRIPPQLITQIHRKTDIVFCPSCQRILYVRAKETVKTEG